MPHPPQPEQRKAFPLQLTEEMSIDKTGSLWP